MLGDMVGFTPLLTVSSPLSSLPVDTVVVFLKRNDSFAHRDPREMISIVGKLRGVYANMYTGENTKIRKSEKQKK